MNFELNNRIKMLNPYSNVDALYGPYESLEEALQSVPEEVRAQGLTIGVVNNSGKIEEYWWDTEDLLDGDVSKKIETYELVLRKFTVVAEDNRIKISYIIGGKGLLPKVSISGTSVLQAPVNIDQEVTTYVEMSVPGTYSYTISAFDVLGTAFNPNGIATTKTVSWGDIIVKVTNQSSLKNLLPQQSKYYGKPLGIMVNYNTEAVLNVRICLYGRNTGENEETENYVFPVSDINGKNVTIVFPTEDELHLNYYKNINNVYAVYDDIETSTTKKVKIYGFNILRPGEFALNFPNDIPSIAYSGTSISFDVNLQYGGDAYGQSSISSKVIEVSLDNDNVFPTNISVNTTKNVVYELDDILEEGQQQVEKTLKVQIKDTDIFEERVITIKKVTTPQTPYGQDIYFNANYRSVEPYANYWSPFQDSRTNTPLLPSAGEELTWNSSEATSVLNISDYHFNLDLNIKSSLSGEDEPLVIIERGNEQLLVIGKLQITSSLFDQDGKPYLKNNLALPKDNDYVHIGFGYQRPFVDGNTITYYDCIFINGEIAFCSKGLDIINDNSVVLKFNNTFEINEFSFSAASTYDGIKSCVGAGGNPEDVYSLSKSRYDVFYYNWLTTLDAGQSASQGQDVIELELIPFLEPENSGEDSWWSALRTALNVKNKFGSNIKGSDKNGNTFRFVKFGAINHGDKQGITIVPELFEFQKTDKENLKLDKVTGAICKYRFVKGSDIIFDNNKYCIVQVQGTSTLAYPVPNFLFTFIKYENGEFSLDDSVVLTYTAPQLGNIKNDEELTFNEDAEVIGETNLVAKADSMDSSHLNNTPTCIYFNSLVSALDSDNGDFSGFSKFANYSDAIVGCPLLLKIDSRDTADVDRTVVVDDNIVYNNYGTFMFNTGKSAKDMGLLDDQHPIFSLEGQSNEEAGDMQAGLFSLPSDGPVYDAFEKIQLTCDNNQVTIDASSLTDEEKETVIDYLINSSAFESRSTIDDDDIVDIENHWNDYALPVLRMWTFVNKAEGSDFADYFDKVFNKDYAILYYINLILFGQADNLGKNMMLDCKVGEDVWYIRPYDLDSELGLTNNGYDDFPVYGCISRDHFEERYGRPYDGGSLPEDTFNCYNSASSKLWSKFWTAFKDDIKRYYNKLRQNYITPERIIAIGRTLVNDVISKEQYNIDFSLKHLGTKFSYLNKGGRFLNYQDWITKRFMYVDSYFSYFTINYNEPGYDGYTWTIGKTLIPIFYEANYQEAKTRYGYRDFTYDGVLNKNMQYVFSIVPEALLSMSPIWGNIKTDVLAGKFVNLQSYSGEYEPSLFSNAERFKNLREIEILVPGSQREEINENLTVPDTVRILKLERIDFTGQATIVLGANSGLEELYLHNCNLESLTILNKSLLKKIVITSSSSSDYSDITNLTLSGLNLSELSIDHNTKIGTLDIGGRITVDDVINLSGIHCDNLIFENDVTVKELYLDQLYDLNGTVCNPYNLDEKGIERVSAYTDRENSRASNTQINGEYVYLTRDNFSRITPQIGSETSITLDLSNCSHLETLSCIGFTQLEGLVIPESVSTLNIQFCKNLTKINCDDLEETYFDFNNIENLSSKPFYLFGHRHTNSTVIDGIDYPTFYWYQCFLNNNESFNLLGCKNVVKIKNLNNLNSNFTGKELFAGCMELQQFDNCNILFTDIQSCFKLTENLLNIPGTFTFSLQDDSSISYSFMDSSIPVGTALNISVGLDKKLTDLSIVSAENAFVREINENIGTQSDPIVLNWKTCYGIFSKPLYLSFSPSGLEYETVCCSSYAYGRRLDVSGETKSVYIKLPYATNVARMFLGLNIKIENVDVFENNTSLTTAYSFLAQTKLEKLIDFSDCNHLTDLRFCYASTNVEGYIETGCKLPSSVLNSAGELTRMSVSGMFKNVNLTGVDVINIFQGKPISNASSCFMNTNCNCSGSPFGTVNAALDISCLFGNNNSRPNGNDGIISDLLWINSYMNTSNVTYTNADNITVTQSVGVFEDRIIRNFETVNNSGNSQKRMFRNATIETVKSGFESFLINAIDATSVFEGVSFLPQDTLLIEINNIVENLSKGFMNMKEGSIEIDINRNNNILNTSYCFSGSKGSIEINDQGEDYVYFGKLEDASYMFDNKNNGGGAITIGNLPHITDNGKDVCTLFKGSRNLKNLDYFFRYNTQDINFDLTDCSSLTSMNYAFCKSGITNIPSLPRTCPQLTSIKGAFRKVQFVNQDSMSINAIQLSDARELFCESKSVNFDSSVKNITITITSNSLSNISAASTDATISLHLIDQYDSIFALQPASVTPINGSATSNYVGGDLSIEGSGETGKFLTYTANKWTLVSSTRNITETDNVYSLSSI